VRVCLLLAIALLLAAPLRPQVQAPPATTPVATDFSHLILQRLAAASRGDITRYRQFFAEGAVVIVEDGTRNSLDEIVAAVAREAAANPAHSEYEIKNVNVVPDSSFVMVDYLIVEHVPAGPRSLTFRYRAMDLFVPRAGGWLVLRHIHTSATATPPPLTIDAGRLQDYVGRYEWWPGYIDTITRKGTELYSQTTGEQKATLSLAATPESFFLAGQAPLLVFIRDQSGRVTHYLLHWGDGQVTVARRLP
jgi:ketosteroid isomerase-like protein